MPQQSNIGRAIASLGIIGTYFGVGLIAGLANNMKIAAIEPNPPTPLPSTGRPEQ
jgi:hypothetical protein